MLTVQQRELIIKLKQDGKNQQHIAELIGCSQAAVSKWISKNKSGRTLETLPRSGRPTKLSNTNLKKLRAKLIVEVKKVNDKFCSLNTKQLASIIKKEVNREYSIRHVERIMHKLGFSLITPRSQHIKHDQKKVDEFRDMLKKNSDRNTWILLS
jgi:transposase